MWRQIRAADRKARLTVPSRPLSLQPAYGSHTVVFMNTSNMPLYFAASLVCYNARFDDALYQ